MGKLNGGTAGNEKDQDACPDRSHILDHRTPHGSSAIYLEFTTLKPTLEDLHENPKAVWETATRAENPDLVDARIIQATFPPMLLTLKLGGIGFILSGIFLSLAGDSQCFGTDSGTTWPDDWQMTIPLFLSDGIFGNV